VQYREYISESTNPDRYDCAGNSPYHPQCLLRGAGFKIQVPNFNGNGVQERVINSVEDIRKYIDFAHGLVPHLSEVELLLNVSGVDICPVPLFTLNSLDLLRMCEFAEQGLYPIDGGYFDQPEYLIEAMGIIAKEKKQIAARKQKDG
jgi:hypothetical protein